MPTGTLIEKPNGQALRIAEEYWLSSRGERERCLLAAAAEERQKLEIAQLETQLAQQTPKPGFFKTPKGRALLWGVSAVAVVGSFGGGLYMGNKVLQ